MKEVANMLGKSFSVLKYSEHSMRMMGKFFLVNYFLLAFSQAILAAGEKNIDNWLSGNSQYHDLAQLMLDDSKSLKHKQDTLEDIHSDYGKSLLASLEAKSSEADKLANLLIAMQLWHRNREFASAKLEMRIVNGIGDQAFWRFMPIDIWALVRAQLWSKTRTYFAHQTAYTHEESLKSQVIASIDIEMRRKVDKIGIEIKDIFHNYLALNPKIEADINNSLTLLFLPITEDQLVFKNSLEMASNYVKTLSQILHFELYKSKDFNEMTINFAKEISESMTIDQIRNSIKAFEAINDDKFDIAVSYYSQLQLDILRFFMRP